MELFGHYFIFEFEWLEQAACGYCSCISIRLSSHWP